MNKNKTLLTVLGMIIIVCVVIIGTLAVGDGVGTDDREDSSSQGLAIITDDGSDAAPDVSDSEAEQTPTVTTSSEAAVTTEQAQKKTYTFRSQKLFDQHFEKHGAEFGDITQEDYLRMANELINSESDTVLTKTEKEDGDYVFFDTETGRFAVLSTDGYIRTFFIPDQGIKYYDKQ